MEPVRTLSARIGWHQSGPQSGELRLFGLRMAFGVGDPESTSAPMTRDQLGELIGHLMQAYLEWPDQRLVQDSSVSELARRFESILRTAGYT